MMWLYNNRYNTDDSCSATTVYLDMAESAIRQEGEMLSLGLDLTRLLGYVAVYPFHCVKMLLIYNAHIFLGDPCGPVYQGDWWWLQ